MTAQRESVTTQRESVITQPRLVVERWTDDVADQRLGPSDIEVSRLDVHGDPAEGWGLLEAAHGYQVATRTDVAGVPGGQQWLGGAELISRCPDLLAMCSAGAGYDVIDVDACTRAGIAVCNNSGPGAEAVAEHALGMMLDLAKKITLSDRVVRRGDLGNRLALQGSELLGKTLGIVGMGAIGGRLVELCAPFRMTVVVHDPYLDAETARSHGAESVSLDELLERSDFVQINCPLTAETAGLMGADQFAAMKPTAYFVTTARGGVHDEAALHDALTGGSIAGAGLDVWQDEPPRADNPLLALDNVVGTPHTAGITVEAARHIAEATAAQWITIFAGGAPPRIVNPQVWPRFTERFERIFGRRPESLTI